MSAPQASYYFYRTFSDLSAGGLESDNGKGKGGTPLSHDKLISEFKNHKKPPRKLYEEIYIARLTALISVTVNFIDILPHAFEKYYEGDDPNQTWIVFISVLNKDKSIYHYAENLAKKARSMKQGSSSTNTF